MRGPAIIAMALAIGCTAPNPDFGDTSTGGGTSTTRPDTSTETSASTTTATTTPTTAMPETTEDPTTDLSTGSSSGQVDPATTGEPSFECCDDTDCSPMVRECVCELADEDCCQGTWGETCPNIAIACGGVCDGVEYSCCEPREEPACTGIQNVGGFCFANPECCLVEWDGFCASKYNAATDGSCGFGPCDMPHLSPNCDNPDIVECVCQANTIPACCSMEWHPTCVEQAAECSMG